MRILLINGPNLNLLGTRRPEIYGSTTLADLESMFRSWASELGIGGVETFQSNHEGDLIDRIHESRGAVDGIVFNPGAYTHTSYALHDAIESVELPTVEVHISNVEEREAWRRISVIRPACVHTIYGRGIEGYHWAIRHLAARAAMPFERIGYGPEPDQFAELRLPDHSPAPLLVLIHGGFWRHMWTRDTTDSIAIDATRRGLATLNVEYRRVGTGGGGRTSVRDVVAAITAALGDTRVDGQNWAVAGHSAGGQLALVAAKTLIESGRRPRAIATLGGVADVELAITTGIGDGAAPPYVGSEDPTVLSPVALAPFGAPVMIAHGTGDDRVPVEQADRLVSALAAAGEQPTTFIRPDGGHFEYLDATSPAWNEVVQALISELSG